MKKIQKKLNHIYNEELRSHLFEVIDFTEFIATIEDINKNLEPNHMIPKIKTMGKNDFIQADAEIKDTYLQIMVDLPVISKKRFNITELVPIPMKENNMLYILNFKAAKYYINGTKVLLFEDDVKKSLCSSHGKTIICNTFLEHYTIEAPTCIRNLVLNNSDEECIYKQIKNENYFIKVSQHYVYAYITNPIKLVKSCRGKNKILKLNDSREILLPTGCNIYELTDNTNFENSKTEIEMKNEKYEGKIDLSINNSSQSLNTIPLWDKLETQFLEPQSRAKRIQRSAPLEKVEIEKISFNNTFSDLIPSFGLKEFFGNAIIKWITIAVATVLGLLILKELIIKLITKWGKDRLSQ